MYAKKGSEVSKAEKRYYINNGLKRVTEFTVVEPSALVWNSVENAEKYYITVECGNKDHKHKDFDNGKSTYFNFGNCEMEPDGIKFTVRAEGEGYASSTSKTYEYRRELEEVKEITYDKENETIKWNRVDKAASYEVTIGTKKITTTNTEVSVKTEGKGEIKISVTPKTKGYITPKGTTKTPHRKK